MGDEAFSVFRTNGGPRIGKLAARAIIIEADAVLHVRAQQHAFYALSEALKPDAVCSELGLGLSFSGHARPSPHDRMDWMNGARMSLGAQYSSSLRQGPLLL